MAPFSGGGGVALPVPISQGGTGQTTAAAALAALGGAAAGTHKIAQGTNAGNYSITSNSFADIDGTNLDLSLTVPTGAVAFGWFGCAGESPGGQSLYIGLKVDSTVFSQCLIGGGVTGIPIPASAFGFVVGDGSTHTFKAQAAVTGGTGTIVNNSGFIPLLMVLVVTAT